jgi:hypothetical protein
VEDVVADAVVLFVLAVVAISGTVLLCTGLRARGRASNWRGLRANEVARHRDRPARETDAAGTGPVIIAALVVVATLSFARSASAQTVAPPSPVPSPSPSAAPNPIGPSLGANDPCTSLGAIVTRPTVTNSVCTVRPNHVLIETGYQNTSPDAGGNTVAYPQSLIRVGTSVPALELDVAPPGFARTNAGGMRTTGTTDAGAGLKYVFGYTPKFNWGGQVFVTAPTGLNGFAAGGSQTTYALQAGYTLSSVFSLAGATQLQSLANGTQRWTSFVPSLVLSASLPNSISVFGEVAQFTNAIGPGTSARTQYILGAYHGFGPRLQLDVEGGYSPTVRTGKYHYVGAGVSYYL